MKIGIAGLGLIGGSILKSIKKHTSHECFGYNRTQKVLEEAEAYLDGVLDEITMSEMDVVFVCFTPRVTIDYVLRNLKNFKKGAIIADICGIKQYVVNSLELPLKEKGAHFVGCHPMAGKEVSGFANSSAELFSGASFIITPTETTDNSAINIINKLAVDMGFGSVVRATPHQHDEIIAYTSQLAHIVSNAYVKSPRLKDFRGFSAGSFQDLTRVARLDSNMWTELFLSNKEFLLSELKRLIIDLDKYRTALQNDDRKKLQELLEEGNVLKLSTL
jgi:prephenate dehydrogenase